MKHRKTVRYSLIYIGPGNGEVVGGRDMYLAQGSQTASCLVVVSRRMLTVFSWVMIQDFFLLTKRKDTVGLFQARAIVSFVPMKMNIISRWTNFGVFGQGKFRRARCGDFCIGNSVIFLMTLNILFHRPLILGQSHQMCSMDPTCPQLRKYTGEAFE